MEAQAQITEMVYPNAKTWNCGGGDGGSGVK